MSEHREFIGSYERIGDCWSVDDQIADPANEVVRCRDCRHFDSGEVGGGEWYGCELLDFAMPDMENGFCKWRQRRDA